MPSAMNTAISRIATMIATRTPRFGAAPVRSFQLTLMRPSTEAISVTPVSTSATMIIRRNSHWNHGRPSWPSMRSDGRGASAMSGRNAIMQT
jgi:hypothetical protein